MQLRWSAAIALWTILSGPVLNNHGTFTAPSREPARTAVQKETNRQDAKDTKTERKGNLRARF